MNRIAVVSAFNPDSYGMYSVDLAAQQFFSDLGLPFTQVVTQNRTRTGRLRFRLIRSARELAEFDTVVYWGDFLNNPMWGAGDYVNREMKLQRVADQQQAWENWCSLYLDVRKLSPRTRVYAIGGCFLGASGPALALTHGRFEEFVRLAQLVAPRDGPSLEVLRHLVPDGHVSPGMDCAWLLRHSPAPDRSGASYFVCFLGRTLRGLDRAFLQKLGRRTGLKPVWLDWLNLDKPRFLAHWRFRQMHRLIAGARFVVTDTYHLVINTLSRGVPAICLHDAREAEQNGTLGDYKKRALIEQVGLDSLLVDVGDMTDIAARIQSGLEAVSGTGFSVAMEAITRRRDEYEARLRAAFLQPVAATKATTIAAG